MGAVLIGDYLPIYITDTATRHNDIIQRPVLPVQELLHAVPRRYQSLTETYGAGREDMAGLLRRQAGELLELARDVVLIEDRTRWQSHQRYSGRQRQRQSQSGLLGRAAYGNVPPAVCELLLFGILTHLGKQTSMGMGAYSLSTANRIWQPPLWKGNDIAS